MKQLLSNQSAWKESITDTVVALIMNLPLNMSMLYVCKLLEMTLIQTSLTLSCVFTVVAVIRKYCTRIYFSK